MGLCELYKKEDITIRINGNIYHGPIKRMYQTFYDRWIEVPYQNEWYAAKIIGVASEKEIYYVNNTLWCTIDLVTSGKIQNTVDADLVKKTNIVSDWLFGIEFKDPENQYYELTNGMVISAK